MKRNTIRVWHQGCTACLLQLIPLIWLLFPQGVYPASLESSSANAWESYVESAAMRMKQRLIPGKTFLSVDKAPERLARVRTGDIVLSPTCQHDPQRVPSGLITTGPKMVHLHADYAELRYAANNSPMLGILLIERPWRWQ